MGLLDKLGEVRARQQEKEQEELRQEEQELEARSLYFPLKSFDQIFLEDIEITPLGHNQAIVEYEDEEIGLIYCPLDEEQIEDLEEINLCIRDGKLCVQLIADEDSPIPFKSGMTEMRYGDLLESVSAKSETEREVPLPDLPAEGEEYEKNPDREA